MDREIDLLRYLPDFMQNYKGMQEIAGAEVPEFKTLEYEKKQVFENQFILSCNEWGIRRYERMLGTPSGEENLADRKLKVITKWMDSIPYTRKVLSRQLETICGTGTVKIQELYNLYQLLIDIFAPVSGMQITEVKKALATMVPANLITLITGHDGSEFNVNVGTDAGLQIISQFYPRYNLEPLKFNKSCKFNSKYKFRGYKADRYINFYPLALEVHSFVEVAHSVAASTESRCQVNVNTQTDALFEVAGSVPLNLGTQAEIDIRRGVVVPVETAGAVQISHGVNVAHSADMYCNMAGEALAKVGNHSCIGICAGAKVIVGTLANLKTEHNLGHFNGKSRFNRSRKFDSKTYSETL